MRLLKFLRFIRLLKIIKFKQLSNRINEYLEDYALIKLFFYLLKLFLIVIVLAHWLSCLFNLV